MSAKKGSDGKRSATNAELRHRLGILAFGAFALVIVLLVLFPKLRPGQEKETPIPEEALSTRLLVLAASSLTEVLTDAARDYEAENPEWRLELSFAASNVLQRQIENGAPADLFLSASAAPAEALVEGSWVMRDQNFVMWTTDLVIIAPANAAEMEERGAPNGEDENTPSMTPADALRGARRIAIGDVGVPVGEYAREALDDLDLLGEASDRLVPLPQESAVLQAVATGACDRGLVYASSVQARGRGGRVRVVSVLPEGSHAPVTYHGAIPASSPHAEAITAFLLYLTAGDGATILQEAGFRAPVAAVH